MPQWKDTGRFTSSESIFLPFQRLSSSLQGLSLEYTPHEIDKGFTYIAFLYESAAAYVPHPKPFLMKHFTQAHPVSIHHTG